MTSGIIPFENQNLFKIVDSICYTNYDIHSILNDKDDLARSLIYKMLEKDPNKRLSICKIKDDQYILL